MAVLMAASDGAADAATPGVLLMNRAHLPVLLSRYVEAVARELHACDDAAEHQVRLLLGEPLLLLLVELEGQSLKARGAVCSPRTPCAPSAEAADGGSVAWRALLPELRGPLVGELRRAPAVDVPPTHPMHRDDSFRFPADTLQEARRRAESGSVHARLMNLVPITARSAGQSRNAFCYHRYRASFDRDPDLLLWSRYQHVKTLGEGHFGQVFHAEERCSGQHVAIKVFDRPEPDVAEDGPEDCTEGSILNALGHPNLIRVLEVLETRDSVHVVMELAEGASLARHAAQTARGPWIVGAMQQIVSATAYCHTLNLLHGDLKPENVLVSGFRPDGCPLCLVCDFGHASIATRRRGLPPAGDPRYAAPEVLERRGLSHRSDVFMLGMMMFELVAGGYLPFFQEPASKLDSQSLFYESTLAYFMVRSGCVLDRMRAGLDFNDLEQLRVRKLPREEAPWGPPEEARELLASMLAWEERARPCAEEVLRSEWITSGHRTCVAARERQRGPQLSFGLWQPERPSLAAGLERRAHRSWPYRLFLAGYATALDTSALFTARLLFRWMDDGEIGKLRNRDFRKAFGKVGLPEALAERCFAAADLYSQGWVDFKNFVAFMLDPELLAGPQLESFARAMVNRIGGAVAAAAAGAADEPFDGSQPCVIQADVLEAMFGVPQTDTEALLGRSRSGSDSEGTAAVEGLSPPRAACCEKVQGALKDVLSRHGKRQVTVEDVVHLVLSEDLG